MKGCEVADVNGLVCGAYVVGRSGERWAEQWCACKSERHGVGFGEEKVSTLVRLILMAGRADGMRIECPL